MEKGCVFDGENPYRACRKRAAVSNDAVASMERAAEQLGISVSSLNQYELGITKSVPVDMVVLMADLYKAPELRNYYCKNECPIGRQLPIATYAEDLQTVTLRLLDCMDEDGIKAIKKKLVSIACDGKITEEEVDEFGAIVDRLEKLMQGISQLRMLAEKYGGSTK